MISTAIEAFTAFSATNIDDIVILVLLFSRLNHQLQAIHVVAGQFLGIAVLVAASLLGFAGRSVVPEAWIGLLGLMPISLGFSLLIERLDPLPFVDCKDDTKCDQNKCPSQRLSVVQGVGWAGMLGVASLTIANGSENIGVYMPMLAHQNVDQLLITLTIFFGLTAAWCLAAWWLTRAPGVATLMQRYADALLPAVLIGIGGLILTDSQVLQHPPQAVISLTCLAVMVISALRQLQHLLSIRILAGVQEP